MAFNKALVWLIMWITLTTADRPAASQGKTPNIVYIMHMSRLDI